MRRSQNEVINRSEIDSIIRKCDVIRIGISVEDTPYIVPMNFGYTGESFYCHCAKEGRKLDMLSINPAICFELDTDHQLITMGDEACKWTMTYSSVMGTGQVIIVEDKLDKQNALNLIMAQYGGKEAGYTYPDKMLEATLILRIDITSISGKKK